MRNEDTYAGTAADAEGPGIVAAARKVSEGLGELGRALSDRRQGVVEPLADFIQERPLAAAGVAFGIGYILAGGIFSRMTGRALGFGWRLGGMALARSVFGSLGTTGRGL
jgi:hypothetical protein